MITITREQAKDLRNAFQCWQQDYDPAEDKEQYDMFELGVIAMDALLASLEAEPVAYIRDGFRTDGVHFCGGIITAEEHDRTKAALSYRYNWKHQTLYAAPPVPASVSDESAVESLATDLMKRIDKITGERHIVATLSSLRVSIVDACRAAMLQGAEPVTTAYKLPPHIYRELVNRLHDTAAKYQGCQQLREQLSRTLQEVIQPASPQQEVK